MSIPRLSQHLLTLSLVLMFGTILGGQETYIDRCFDTFEESEPNSDECFFASLRLTDALRSKNLDDALANANLSLTIAQQIGKENFATVAKMDIASICVQMGIRPVAGEDDNSILMELLHLPDSADVNLKAHFHLARFEGEFYQWNIVPESETLEKLDHLQVIIDKCDDSQTKIRFNTLSIFLRCFKLGRDIDQDALESLIRNSNSLAFSDGLIVAHLVEGMRTKTNKQVASFNSANDLAQKTNSMLFQFFAEIHIGTYYRCNKQHELAAESYRSAFESAKLINSEAFKSMALLKLCLVHRKLGNKELASDYYLQHLSHKPVPKEAAEADRVIRLGKSIFQDSGMEGLSAHFEDLQLDPAIARELNSKAIKVESLAKELVEQKMVAKALSQQQQERFDSLEGTFNKEVSYLHRVISFASLVAIGLACLGLFIWVQTKFSSNAEPLKQTTLENREICDELAVRVARMERMESLGLMAGSVAHDFNNIMVGVLGNAEVIQMVNNSNQNDFVRERMSGIIRSAKKAAKLSKQMLVCSGRDSTNRHWMDLNRLILQYAPVLKEACTQQQDLSFEFESGEIFANVDPVKIEQAVLNLVSNAVEASDHDGRITIRSGTVEIDSVDDTSLFGTRTTGGKFCYFEVADEGCGISTEDLEKIFEPFYSKSELGRGLGLSVVYGVVESHDGFIQCHSTAGKSATFRILIPLERPVVDHDNSIVNRMRERFDNLVSHPEPGAVNRRTVVVIDDDPCVRDLVSQLLTQDGYSVISSGNGITGLGEIESHKDQILCVLLDIMMPDIRGDEVLELMLTRDLNLPVIIMTGFNGGKNETIETHDLVIKLIQKPFQANQLLNSIGEVAELVGVKSLKLDS